MVRAVAIAVAVAVAVAAAGGRTHCLPTPATMLDTSTEAASRASGAPGPAVSLHDASSLPPSLQELLQQFHRLYRDATGSSNGGSPD